MYQTYSFTVTGSCSLFSKTQTFQPPLPASRLQQLEQEVVGGEQARNQELQQKRRQRKKLADQRKVQLIHALSEDSEDSNSVMLKVYDSIQEELYAKSQLLIKVQGKVGRRSETIKKNLVLIQVYISLQTKKRIEA